MEETKYKANLNDPILGGVTNERKRLYRADSSDISEQCDNYRTSNNSLQELLPMKALQ